MKKIKVFKIAIFAMFLVTIFNMSTVYGDFWTDANEWYRGDDFVSSDPGVQTFGPDDLMGNLSTVAPRSC